jgi:hypothetical protein
VQLFANVLLAALTPLAQCYDPAPESDMVYSALGALILLVTFGVSGIAKNLLCHRYLLERATTMIKL